MRKIKHLMRPSTHAYGFQDEANYIKDLANYQLESKSVFFMNDSIGHATLLADTMIGSAEDYVIIYSGSLDQTCYEFVMKNILPTVKVRVLIDQPLATAYWIKSLKNPLIDVQPIGVKALSPLADVNHFFVCDGVAFRYETDHAKSQATACFNDSSFSAALTKRFAKAWQQATSKTLDI